jgi:hypothetical protein
LVYEDKVGGDPSSAMPLALELRIPDAGDMLAHDSVEGKQTWYSSHLIEVRTIQNAVTNE